MNGAFWLRLALLAATLVLGAAAQAAPAGEQLPLRLQGQHGAVAPDLAWAWLDRRGQARIDQVAGGAVNFQPMHDDALHPLRPGAALWIRLRLQRTAGATPRWILELPMPLLDKATLFLRSQAGWRSESAGDHVEMARWPEAGRYPAFALDVPYEQPLELYLRVEHNAPLSLPLRIAPAADHEQGSRLEYLVLGLAFGGLLLLVTGALWQAWELRDSSYFWFAGYGSLTMLAAAAYTGVAGHLLWGNLPAWSDAAPGCLVLLAGGAALKVTRQLAGASLRRRLLSLPLRVGAGLSVVLALAYVFLIDRRHGMAVVGLYLMLVCLASVLAATQTWRRSDPVGKWLMAGALPLGVAVLLAVGRLYGWFEGSWLTEYLVVAAITWNLPMLKAALNRRMRERRSAQLRQQALASHDPLTGLPKVTPFRARLRKALLRYAQTREPASLVVIEVANLPAIKLSRGAEAAEECLLRSVLKIQRLVREADMIGRLGEATFGLILEGVDSRARVNDLASHLVASGLIQDPEHPRDPLLQFHVAAALLSEQPRPGITLMEELLQLLAGMSPRTRRPIRYLQPQAQDSRPGSGALPGQLPQALHADRIPEVI